MKPAISHDFPKWIVKQDTMPREPTPHDDIVTLSGSVEKVAKFREEMRKIAVHC